MVFKDKENINPFCLRRKVIDWEEKMFINKSEMLLSDRVSTHIDRGKKKRETSGSCG